MRELLPDGGMVRKLWVGEADAYRDHLLRLDPESRHRRFSGAISDEIIGRHAATISEVGVVVLSTTSVPLSTMLSLAAPVADSAMSRLLSPE